MSDSSVETRCNLNISRSTDVRIYLLKKAYLLDFCVMRVAFFKFVSNDFTSTGPRLSLLPLYVSRSLRIPSLNAHGTDVAMVSRLGLDSSDVATPGTTAWKNRGFVLYFTHSIAK